MALAAANAAANVTSKVASTGAGPSLKGSKEDIALVEVGRVGCEQG